MVMPTVPPGDTRRVGILIAVALFALISILTVGFRLWAKRIQRHQLSLPDYTIILALFFTLAMVGLSITSVMYGVGQDPRDVDSKHLEVVIKCLLVGQMLWALSTTCVRASVLFLYAKLFPTRGFRRVCFGVLSLNLIYPVAVILTSALLCQPFRVNWDYHVTGGRCGDVRMSNRLIGAFNLIFDFLLVGMPIPMLWGLNMAISKKIMLSMMFGLGLLICVITGLRIQQIELIGPNNVPDSFISISLLAILEPTLGIISACLPVLKPVLRKVPCFCFKPRNCSESQENGPGPWPQTIGSAGKKMVGTGTLDSDGKFLKLVGDDAYYGDISNRIVGPSPKGVDNDASSEDVELATAFTSGECKTGIYVKSRWEIRMSVK